MKSAPRKQRNSLIIGGLRRNGTETYVSAGSSVWSPAERGSRKGRRPKRHAAARCIAARPEQTLAQRLGLVLRRPRPTGLPGGGCAAIVAWSDVPWMLPQLEPNPHETPG